ncbi:MAG: anaerobic sulfatase-maturation protein [Bacteroidales bacterium]
MPELNFLTAHDRMHKKRAFQLMTKPYGPVCNLQCDYCYYLEKANIYDEKKNVPTQFKMSDEVLEKYVHDYIESQPGEEVQFTWQGGEPTLLGVDFFRKALQFQQKHGEGRRISNTLQTNGTLITDEWAEFFVTNNFLIGLSIDGPADLHDYYRKYTSGKGSFSRIMDTVKLFHKHKVEFNTLTVVNDRNAKVPLKVYRFLKDIGSQFMQFIPIVEREAVDPGMKLKLVANDYKKETWVTEESVESEDWGKFLAKIFDEWVRIDIGNIFVNYFDNTLAPYAGDQPSLCTMRLVCGDGLVMEHNGDVYSCDHYVYPQFHLGNVMNDNLEELAKSDVQLKFGLDKRDTLPKECRECEFLKMCGGDCPKHRFVETENGEMITYLHDGFLYYFRHVDKYMKLMAEELKNKRPPANIMKMFPDKEKRRLLQRTRYKL